MGSLERAPDEVRIFYSKRRESHIFTSPDLPNLLVGHPDLHVAFDMVSQSVSRLVRRVYQSNERYSTDMSFSDFKKKLSDLGENTSLAEPVIRVKATHENALNV